MQTRQAGQTAEKSLEHNDGLYAVSVLERCVRKPPADNAPCLKNYFPTNCRSVIPMLLKGIGTTVEQFV